MRMWLRDELRKIDDQLTSFLKLTAARAESEINYIMPAACSTRPLEPLDALLRLRLRQRSRAPP